MLTCWPSSRRCPGTPLWSTWCWGKTSTWREGRDRAGRLQCSWCWSRCRWWMFLLFLPPQGAGWNPAEAGLFGARRRVCELDYVTYCTHTCTYSLWCCAQTHAHARLSDSVAAQTFLHTLVTRLKSCPPFCTFQLHLPPVTLTRCQRAHGSWCCDSFGRTLFGSLVRVSPFLCSADPTWQIVFQRFTAVNGDAHSHRRMLCAQTQAGDNSL